jgi:hypothetical protein
MNTVEENPIKSTHETINGVRCLIEVFEGGWTDVSIDDENTHIVYEWIVRKAPEEIARTLASAVLAHLFSGRTHTQKVPVVGETGITGEEEVSLYPSVSHRKTELPHVGRIVFWSATRRAEITISHPIQSGT